MHPVRAFGAVEGCPAVSLVSWLVHENRDGIRRYYAVAPEHDRLATNDGWLERERTIELVAAHVPHGSRILDLGCGTGIHAVELLRRGYRVTLVDLSPELLEQARRHVVDAGLDADAILLGDAAALEIDDGFDAVLCAGPLYHASDDADLRRMLDTCGRLLRPRGHLLGTFIPRATGISGLIARAVDPAQIQPGTLTKTWETGTFTNQSLHGFTGAYFIDADDMQTAVEAAQFEVKSIESLRGLAAPYGPALTALRETNPGVLQEVLDLVRLTANRPDVIGMSWHAMVIAEFAGHPSRLAR
jgi:S-adenosylmethionine-dependent methyltransferase